MTDRNEFVEQIASWIDADISQAEAFYDVAAEHGYITQGQEGIMWSESAYADYPSNDGADNVDTLTMYVELMPTDD